MTDIPTSQLPQGPEYWERLARRIRDDASGPLAAYAAAHDDLEDGDEWYGVLARRAPWLVAASAAAMLTVWLALPTSESSVAFRWMERSLAPNEIAGALFVGAEPPSVDLLLVQFEHTLEDTGEGRQP